MQAKWMASVAAVLLSLALGAPAQEGGSQNNQSPVLKTRPNDGTNPAQAQPGSATASPQGSGQVYGSGQSHGSSQIYGAPPNAIPDGSRFIIKLKDTLDTHKLNETNPNKHFKAELREDLITPSGLIIPRGRTVKGHVARGEEGEIYRRGPDKKKVITNAAIGAAVGAAAGAAADGGRGAAIGAAAGAGVGTGTSLLLRGSDLRLDKGTQLEVRLDRDLVVPNH